MIDRLKLAEYKQQIADLYSGRSAGYDNGEWHPRIAHRLVELANIQPGQKVLDLAAGTGMVAIEAAQIVGNEGYVIGIDIATGMVELARQKVAELGLNNIEFQVADAEELDFPANSFDRIFCSSAFIWMSDLAGALKHWHRLLKPGGILGFHAFADTAFVAGVVSQQVLEKYDVSLLLSKPTGTVKKCRNLLGQAGFESIDIKTEPDGNYISLEKAKSMWAGNPSFPTPGQYPNPLLQLTSAQLAQAKVDFEIELEQLQTSQGIWDDGTIFYVFGQKAAS
ncbi:methyltransferase domain-containing protein [Chamaesiphon sp. VAR_48_metabat_403]|uniref:class I SAM-dependent methyltransferase n=1 Tax=Chamaesiphon sp. VAR_48_metabat_403 TaxID=2964700 RepID=UPI00286D6B59|nr:methyltransferase domain-containing protein [Chamaesiphon sp. VAR_48_metabat_403]